MTQTKYTLISPNTRMLRNSHPRITMIICAVIFVALWITYIQKVHYINSNYFQNDLSSSYPEYNETERQKIELGKKCFQPAANLDNVILLPDILEHEVKPNPGKSIFFIVTTCTSNGSVILNGR